MNSFSLIIDSFLAFKYWFNFFDAFAILLTRLEFSLKEKYFVFRPSLNSSSLVKVIKSIIVLIFIPFWFIPSIIIKSPNVLYNIYPSKELFNALVIVLFSFTMISNSLLYLDVVKSLR